MTNLLESLKKLLGLDLGDEKIKRPVWKKVNVLLVIAAAGIMLIILANAFGPVTAPGNSPESAGKPDAAQSGGNVKTAVDKSSGVNGQEELLGERLEEVLAEIDGVGNVNVTVNLASTPEKDFALNTRTDSKTTRENDNKGGNRTISEANEDGQMVLVRENQGSREEPVIVKEIKPEVKGVMVVADGAGDPAVKADLMNAVHVYLDVPLYRVIVLSRESR